MLIYYKILGLESNATDDAIRSRYLEQVKRYSPEKAPDAFKMITLAYDAIKDRRSRIHTRLFGTSDVARCEDILRALALPLEIKRRSPSLADLVELERHTNR